MNTLCHCCLSLIIGLISLPSSAALSFATHPIVFPQAGSHILWIAQGIMQPEPSASPDSLPNPIQQAILQDIAQQTGEGLDSLQIIKAEERTWPDGCLGLAPPDVLCTMALVEGWQVKVSNGSQTWTYRTDTFGAVVKLEPPAVPAP